MNQLPVQTGTHDLPFPATSPSVLLIFHLPIISGLGMQIQCFPQPYFMDKETEAPTDHLTAPNDRTKFLQQEIEDSHVTWGLLGMETNNCAPHSPETRVLAAESGRQAAMCLLEPH